MVHGMTPLEIKSRLAAARGAVFSPECAIVDPLAALHTFSRYVDDALRAIYHRHIDRHAADRDYCLVALGGYGRGELWPYSDIDILILHRDRHGSETIGAVVKDFWNIGLTMGCVVRTLDECRAIMSEDLATDTALLESRYLYGDHGLYDLLQKDCIRPYFKKKKKEYIGEMSAALRDGLFSSENSLYRIEPDLKNGICTLRDCQRLLWAERVKQGTIGFAQLHAKSGFSLTETRMLASGYAFLAGLRSALHVAARQQLDILEMQYQDAIAARYGFKGKHTGRLLEVYFKTVRNVRLCLLSFLEKDLSGKSIWSDVRRRVSSLEIEPGISLLDGILFLHDRKKIELDHPESALRIFKHSLACQGTLSVDLRNKIRHAIEGINPEGFKSKAAGDVFLSILAWPDALGQVLLTMHETGLLSKMISPFAALTCKVEYDQYHEFTVDQHSLMAIGACDEFAGDADDKIRGIYTGLSNKIILRLAVLLHDIGKAEAGDHTQNGAVIAGELCEHLGLMGEQVSQIQFLVAHHLDMSNLSLLRDFEEHNLDQFAAEIADVETLNLLYLLTIADIRSVGHNTWTGWKAYQLEQLYDRVYRILDLSEHGIKKVHHMPSADYPYVNDLLPGERAEHLQWLERVDKDGLHLHQKIFAGFERWIVCAHDRVGVLSDIIGCMTSEGYNILSAKIHSTPNQKVLDIFHVEPPDKPRLTSEKRLANIFQKWELIKRACVRADSLVADRIRKYPPPLLRGINENKIIDIRINNKDSLTATIVEIETADNFGLLHKIAWCFHENNINVVAAKLSTRNDRACDVFYVTDIDKNKILDDVALHCLVAGMAAHLSSEITQIMSL